MPSASFIQIREQICRPHSSERGDPIPIVSVPLAGCDQIYGWFNVHFVYFFEQTLNTPALKESLAKALDAFPILAGRAREEKPSAWIECNGAGALVREQVARVTGTDGLVHGQTSKYLTDFAKGPFSVVPNDPHSPILTVTLSEVTYGEGFTCRPPVACRPSSGSSRSSSNRGEEEAGGEQPTIRYAIGISFSHSATDGCGIAHFVGNWARAGAGLPLQSAVNARGILLDDSLFPGHNDNDEQTSSSSSGGGSRHVPEALAHKFKYVSSLGRMRVMSSYAMSQLWGEVVHLRFEKEELEAIKAKAMAPLQGTSDWVSTSNALAGHLWPIISELFLGQKSEACIPLCVVVNSRKQLTVPSNYCGNVVSIQEAPSAVVSDSLTAKSLKVRHASSPSVEEARRDHAYMQRMGMKGLAGQVMYKRMRDIILGRPGMIWDDISSFQGAKEHMTFSGCTPIAADVSFNIPGMSMVIALPPPYEVGGKEVRIFLPTAMARKLNSAEMQARVHEHRPWPTAAATPSCSAAAVAGKGEESKEGIRRREEGEDDVDGNNRPNIPTSEEEGVSSSSSSKEKAAKTKKGKGKSKSNKKEGEEEVVTEKKAEDGTAAANTAGAVDVEKKKKEEKGSAANSSASVSPPSPPSSAAGSSSKA